MEKVRGCDTLGLLAVSRKLWGCKATSLQTGNVLGQLVSMLQAFIRCGRMRRGTFSIDRGGKMLQGCYRLVNGLEAGSVKVENVVMDLMYSDAY